MPSKPKSSEAVDLVKAKKKENMQKLKEAYSLAQKNGTLKQYTISTH